MVVDTLGHNHRAGGSFFWSRMMLHNFVTALSCCEPVGQEEKDLGRTKLCVCVAGVVVHPL